MTVDATRLGFLKYSSYYIESAKVFYVSTPKVACTSLKWWVADRVGVAEAVEQSTQSLESSPELAIHDLFHIVAPHVTGLDADALQPLLESPAVFRFALVRNPYKRLFSAWQSKVLLREPLQVKPYLDKAFFNHPVNTEADIAAAFEAFLEYLSVHEAPNFQDPHWGVQVDLLRPDIVKYACISQIEDTAVLDEQLKKCFGEDYVSPFDKSQANESIIPFSASYITDRSATLVRELYARDFAAFGYSLDVPQKGGRLTAEQFQTALKGIEMLRERHAQILNFHQRMASQSNELNTVLADIDTWRNGLETADQQIRRMVAEHSASNAQIAELTRLNEEAAIVLARSQDEAAVVQARLREESSKWQRSAAEFSDHAESLSGRVAYLEAEVDKFKRFIAQGFKAVFSSKPWKLARRIRGVLGEDRHPLAGLLKALFNFDRHQYLLSNGDVRAHGGIAEEHFLVHGIVEGRSVGGGALIAPEMPALVEFAPQSASPEAFDPEFYLAVYPDVKAAGIDPLEHYQSCGRGEGRKGSFGKLEIANKDKAKVPGKKTFLVVSHEASRTGAPVLSYNIAQQLAKKHNVVVLLLGGGDLTADFVGAEFAVVGPVNVRGNVALAKLVVTRLLNEFSIDYVVANSIESRWVLEGFAGKFIPTLSLVHEFAAYTRPHTAFREALFWSGEVVFSANITFENAKQTYAELNTRHTHILPQGRCLVPAQLESNEAVVTEENRVQSAMRPTHQAAAVVILGAGYVQLRKGVDLFIECAARVVASESGRNCRFVWVGQGYNPETDVNYSVYLRDQIQRANLQNHVFFVTETSAIDTVYRNTDVFLMTSRLDPLPNVAIDALCHHVPVVCFDKTTGIADFLADSGLRDECVAGYLDTVDMASKVVALVESEEFRMEVAQRGYAAASQYFDMAAYIDRIEWIAEDVGRRAAQEASDYDALLGLGGLVDDFTRAPHQADYSREELARVYIRSWASGIDRRKPMPGFDPASYAASLGPDRPDADPFVHFLKSGRPRGPWLTDVLGPQSACPARSTEEPVALHIHVFYLDLLAPILERVAASESVPDLFISVPDEERAAQVLGCLSAHGLQAVSIKVVPNRGRDIGPMLTAFGPALLRGYSIVGHVHTKKTKDLADATIGKRWFDFLIDNLLGADGAEMMDVIVASMQTDATIGLVYPSDPNCVGWGANRTFAQELASAMDLGPLADEIDFPVGTMFWCRTEVLKPFVEHFSSWDDYPEEPLPYDGTILHAIERLIPAACERRGLAKRVTHVPGRTR